MLSSTNAGSDVARHVLTGLRLAHVVAKAVSIVTVLRAEIIDGTVPAGTRLKEESIGVALRSLPRPDP
jgi:DNA-binding GntR family transcriptional regulator